MSNNKKPEIIIDVHTHVFDFSYIPVTEVALRFLFDIPEQIAKGLSKLIKWRTPRGTDPRFDFADDEDEEKSDEVLMEELVNSIPKNILIDPDVINTMNFIKDNIDFPERKRGVEHFQYSFADEDDDARLQKLRDILEGWGLVGFFLLMLSNEKQLFKRLKKTYKNVDLYIHHMLDVNLHFNGTAELQFPDEQVNRIAELVKESDGKLLAFIPFSPFRDDSLDKIIKPGIERGFCGVKFYPPFGYRPIFNLDAPQARISDHLYTHELGLSGKELDGRCLELFEYCVENDIPVITHCTAGGFQARNGYGLNSDPYYWHWLFEEHPELSSLRLLLAHSGGGAAWFTKDVHNEEFLNPRWVRGEPYGGKVYNLCVNYENVYCDAAYLDEILNPNNHKTFIDRLESLFIAYPEFADKFIYGSDFQVLMAQKNFDAYLDNFIEVFNDPKLKDYSPGFFGKNAIRYLNLDGNTGYLARVKQKGILSKKGLLHLKDVVLKTK